MAAPNDLLGPAIFFLLAALLNKLNKFSLL